MKREYLGASSCRLSIMLAGALLGLGLVASANAQTKKPAAPAKAAAPAKPAAAPAKPAGGASAGAAHPATAAANHPTATANHPTTTANHPTTANANHPTTANGGANEHPTANKPTTAGGEHPATAAGKAGAGPTHGGAPAAKGLTTKTAANGAKVTTRSNGKVADLHDPKRNMDIHHGLDGSRRVEMRRPDGSRVVAERGRPGYVERSYSYHGHDFARRAYYDHGVRYDRYYRGYYYGGPGGVYMNVYAPAYYYNPGFYGWAYNPWSVSVAYGWGWGAAPWYGFYGGFFAPYPVYPSAAFWLTDYMIAANLQAAYAVAAAAGAAASAQDASLRIVENENGSADSPVWTFDGNHGVGVFGTGNQPLTIESFANGNIAIRRTDTSGPWHGSALYTGHIDGNQVSGQVTYFDPGGNQRFGTWQGSVSGSAVDASAAPVATQTASGAPALTPDVKQLIADEVKIQLELEYAEAAQTAQQQDVDPGSSGIQRMIDDVGKGHPHIFVVGDGLDVADASSGQECHVSDGDALQMQVAPPQNATSANLVVKASKGGVECAPGTTVAVNVSDLQEMQNHMRENIDVGLKQLQTNQGKGGLPAAPPSAQAAPTQPQYAALAPPPPPSDAADVQTANKQADQAEAEAKGTPTAALSAPH